MKNPAFLLKRPVSNCQFICGLTQHGQRGRSYFCHWVHEKDCRATLQKDSHFRWSQWFKTATKDVAADAGKPADGGDPGARGFRIHALLWERERECCRQLNLWTHGDRNARACPCIANTWPGHSFPVITVQVSVLSTPYYVSLKMPETNLWCGTVLELQTYTRLIDCITFTNDVRSLPACCMLVGSFALFANIAVHLIC